MPATSSITTQPTKNTQLELITYQETASIGAPKYDRQLGATAIAICQ